MSLPTDSLTPTPGGALAGYLSELRTKWGWFVALGLLMIAAGAFVLGNVALGTVVSVLYIGVVLAISGVAQIFHAFQVKGWGAFAFWLLDGLLYVAAGVVAFAEPLLAAAVLTLLLGAALIVGGVFRIIAAFQMRPAANWGWIAASAVLTVLLGVMIVAGWPVSGIWVLGLFLGVDLVFNGLAVLMLGLRLKK
ncbi:HdeD family acid-resistance protein [Ancylobacter radicis]|uniref:HdeD family acid-resistance protein n=1 Tax=Ancylobacter radicis TaxID=2836179 RepID=A0ABS5R465_9HYPH|nr:HdeD family acid-resistance protein [Ancylobacter radicis]MBS9475604.1 HdeD family acid-resistance protein [Ancylobacter radicis]